MQRAWGKVGQGYYDANKNRRPPFGFFIQCLRDQAKKASADNFAVIEKKTATTTSSMKKNPTVKVLHTESSVENKASTSAAGITNKNKHYCYFHKCTNHETAKCKGFAKSADKVKQELMSKNGLCFGCLEKQDKGLQSNTRLQQVWKSSSRHPSSLRSLQTKGYLTNS